MHTSSPSITTPSEKFRAELERIGCTLEGVPDDLTTDQAVGLLEDLLRQIDERVGVSA